MLGNIKKKIVPAAGMIAGGVAANFASSKLAGTIGNDKLRNGAILGLGIVVSGMKGDMMKNVGAGMITVGGMKLVGSLVPQLAGLTGVQDDVLNGLYDDTLNDDDVSGVYDEIEDEVYD